MSVFTGIMVETNHYNDKDTLFGIYNIYIYITTFLQDMCILLTSEGCFLHVGLLITVFAQIEQCFFLMAQ